ncbi:MAG: peptidase M48, Ste24p [Sphingopyxis sp.]|nr:peptidase M48, Ste24p [Sphingopyxis sp.]
MLRPLFRILAGAAAMAPALSATAATPASSPYAALAALEARVAAIGFRLTTANAAWCPALQPQFGWIWGDPRLYREEDRPAALAAYRAGSSGAPFLAAVAPGSPAALAGLTMGEPVYATGDVALPDPDGDAFARVDAVERRFAEGPATDTIAITARNDTTVRLTPVAGCTSDFRVEARDRPAGGADGRVVRISAGLAQYASDDAELAAAVAHEVAHNILRHPQRLEAAGVDRGVLKQFGRNARLIRQTEVEADRLSIWLLGGAGYDPAAAVRFWQKFGRKKGPVLIQPGTHPRWQARVKVLEGEIAAMRAAAAAGAPPKPPLAAAPPPLE